MERELRNSLIELPTRALDWPDLLAADLRRNAVSSLTAWAANHGLTPHSLSRGFRTAFGVTPKRFWLESKSHAAIGQIAKGCACFAAIAADCGFSDQAHMTRAISALTGSPPSYWRA